jgi:predicted PhzF superfamily epimerase YddE/YHI9
MYVRTFAFGEGVPEDPACGSGNAAVGAHIKDTGFDSTVRAVIEPSSKPHATLKE